MEGACWALSSCYLRLSLFGASPYRRESWDPERQSNTAKVAQIKKKKRKKKETNKNGAVIENQVEKLAHLVLSRAWSWNFLKSRNKELAR